MYKLSFTLKQHTPLIHFQHEQEGATLRASEVKPKLDKFIFQKLGNGNIETGIAFAKENKWLIENERPALNYKLLFRANKRKENIKVFEINKVKTDRNGIKYKTRKSDGKRIKDLEPYPAYFGNLDKDFDDPGEYKKFTTTAFTDVTIISPILNQLKNHLDLPALLNEFFLNNNFGTRQSKGFGSFYIVEDDPLYQDPKGWRYRFDLNIYEDGADYPTEVRRLFERINLFYSCLRGGVNIKRPEKSNNTVVKDEKGNPIMIDVFYFKSLLFLYFLKKYEAKWEKKVIKEQFFSADLTKKSRDKNGNSIEETAYGLKTQQANRKHTENKQEHPLFAEKKKELLVRDLLGYSTDEMWKSYHNAAIAKHEVKQDATGAWKMVDDKQKQLLRMKSPILFKPLQTADGYEIFIILKDHETGLKEFLDYKKIGINKNKSATDFFVMDLPDKFSPSEYLEFIFKKENFNIFSHVEADFQDEPEFEILNDIFSQLQH